MDTGYYVLRVDTVPCSNNERFQQVINMILLNSNPHGENGFFITLCITSDSRILSVFMEQSAE